MVDRSQTNTATLPSVRVDHACFGCGKDNPNGLRLHFDLTDDGVVAPFVPQPEHQGFDGIVHGGIISTVLDEAMAWATTSAGVWTVTAEMCVRFKRPLSVGESTTVTARVAENRRRIVAASGKLTLDRDGTIVATATATFVRVSDAVAKAWDARYLGNGASAASDLTESARPNEPSSAIGGKPR
jgi:uncharacterized protein (TIGR00369 family)